MQLPSLRRLALVALPAVFLLQGAVEAAPAAAACPTAPGTQTCTLQVSSDTYTDETHPATAYGAASALAAYEDASSLTTKHLWLTFPTSQLPAGVTVTAATLKLWATASASSNIVLREVNSATQCPEATCTWNTEGSLNLTAAGSSSGSMTASSWVSAPITALGAVNVGSNSGFRVRPGATGTTLSFASKESDPTHAAQLSVTYTVPTPSGGSSGTPPPTTGACASSLTVSSGLPFCLAGQAAPSAMNQTLPASPATDANSAGIVANLNSGQHNVDFSEFGTTVDDTASGTTTVTLHCTEAWGTCSLEGKTLVVNPAWRPSWGSDHAIVVIDRTARKVYDLWQVSTTSSGTIAISNGTLSTSWGGVTSLDGNGQNSGATGSNTSSMFGMVRTFEMAAAPLSPATAIPHALHFSSSFTCSTFRYPATKSDGSSSGNCIPEGARVFLDASANCASVTPTGAEAVCYALQKYGAYATDTGGSPFALGGQGDGVNDVPAVYSNAGLGWDYYDMKSIPWSHLHVASNCQCTQS